MPKPDPLNHLGVGILIGLDRDWASPDPAKYLQDRKSLAAAYLLQSELALLKKENRLGLKAAMRSRDLSRKTGTKKGEAGRVRGRSLNLSR